MTRTAFTAAFLILATAGAGTPQSKPATLPPRLDEYLATIVKLTPEQRSRIAAGAAVTKLLDAEAEKEVAVFGAIWIDAPSRRYVEAVTDIENFERGGGFTITKRVSSPPRLEDFSRMRLTDEDLSDLERCRLGDCEVKLGADALQRFRSEVNWKGPDARAAADALMQRLALEYVTGYLEGGNERLAVYRDKSRPTFVAAEFRSMIDKMPELTTYMPPVRRYLLEYPKSEIAGSASFLYWQEAEFGMKPVLRISHMTVFEAQEATVVASKMLYASHYFWTGLELRVLLPDPARGAGFWFVTVNRSRSDGLSGFTGRFVRGRARSGVQQGVLSTLHATKRLLEGPAMTGGR